MGADKSIFLTVINKEVGEHPRDVNVKVGVAGYGVVELMRMTADDLASTDTETLGGGQIGEDGVWAGSWTAATGGSMAVRRGVRVGADAGGVRRLGDEGIGVGCGARKGKSRLRDCGLGQASWEVVGAARLWLAAKRWVGYNGRGWACRGNIFFVICGLRGRRGMRRRRRRGIRFGRRLRRILIGLCTRGRFGDCRGRRRCIRWRSMTRCIRG